MLKSLNNLFVNTLAKGGFTGEMALSNEGQLACKIDMNKKNISTLRYLQILIEFLQAIDDIVSNMLVND